jgi:NAD(P)-dependent dehydrogenase (short-subunit alcohol dehydrogenase family)
MDSLITVDRAARAPAETGGESMGVVIVTGAGTGIGAARPGVWRPVAGTWSWSDDGRICWTRSRRTIGKQGGKSMVIAADLADAGTPRAIVDRSVAAFGGIDALVNNAAVIKVLPIADYTPTSSTSIGR